ncbi:hypothetical protein HS041_12045 [Planomonospora sp. ID67723]|uniref:hypothetical protein n=1 Tax=Planomonospora sp. ID67723 TaxID=2738134 RepID=UPI0018C40FC3|nr:hypothetical protein [Planomonospora sp. ID67723]MBG0828499.1 hypothetical protein [Planomonospora sp. ID67723]
MRSRREVPPVVFQEPGQPVQGSLPDDLNARLDRYAEWADDIHDTDGPREEPE